MMKQLLTALLFLVSLPALAADPIASLVTSRTSGTAPMCVHFDATGSTDADTTNPFRDLLYRWNFGDPGSGTWTYGANTSLSKNQARGPVAAHCYETAGSYTARVQVCDAAKCVNATQAITVTAADTTFSTTNTTCFYNSTVGTGCPAGATETATSDFDATVAPCIASGKRCLMKRGDTFTASTNVSLTGTIATAQLGAYGSGAKPIVTMTGAYDLLRFNGTISDVAVVDVDMVGLGAATVGGGCATFYAAATDITFLRLTCRSIGNGFGMQGNGDTFRVTGLFVVDSSVYSYTSGNVTYLAIKSSAFLGNSFDDAWGPGYPGCAGCTSEHGMRLQYVQKSLVSNNYFGKASSAKHQLTIRGAPRGSTGAVEDLNLDSNRVLVSDNLFDSTTLGARHMSIAPSGDTQCHWISDILVERNHIKSGVSSAVGAYITAKRVTVRNNIHDGGAVADGLAQVSNANDGTCAADPVVNTANAIPAPDDNWIGSNTIIRTGAITNFLPISYFGNNQSAVTNGTAYNNLAYAPSASNATTVYTVGTTTGTTSGTNSTSTQVKTVNPFTGSPTTAITFRPPTTSYAASGGTSQFPAVAEDFYLCRDRTAAVRYGALVPAARAQCSGTAGP